MHLLILEIFFCSCSLAIIQTVLRTSASSGRGRKVSFLNPYNQSLLNEFNLQNTALSTSGNTLQYTGHIMNPLTGIFNEQRKASSIISTDPLEAEILSTVWMIANKEQQQLLTENFKDIQATLYDL